MGKVEEKKLSLEEIQEILSSSYRTEYKYIEKYGKTAKDTLLKMANSSETIRSEKLGKDLTLDCSLIREKTESDGFVTFGAEAYKIKILDGEKELANCAYQLEPRGVHLSFIGLSEDLDNSYQGTGLGSIVFDKLESLSKSLGAEYIEGRYTPIGKFASSSEAFYKRHGFNFDIDPEDHRTYVRKEIQREPEQTAEQKNEKNS